MPTPSPEGYDRLLDQVVLVSRLREVRALVDFTRLAAPDRGDLEPVARVPLSGAAPLWVPAVEQRGEGIFLQLREDAVAAWTARAAEHPRMMALDGAYRRWAHNTARVPNPPFPHARLTLINTLSHMLIRQAALECGVSSPASGSGSISARHASRRRASCCPRPPAVARERSAGWSRSATGGTSRALLDQAFDDALRCSSDPLCAEHVPADPSAELHAAACHACLFASETTCETNNRWLDRAVLAGLTRDGLAFPR